MRTPSALTPALRAYIRWAPWRFGKRPLWEHAGAQLATKPRSFVAHSRYGFRIAGDQRLVMPRCIYWFGTWEPALSSWIRRSLRPGDVFVDVGANFGYFTLLAARAVGAQGFVVAIEPSPATASRLQENIERNGLRNVRVVRAAAAAEEGKLRLYRAPWNDAENSTVPREGTEDTGEVDALPLHAILSETELSRARVIKVDVEGGELGALRGLLPAIEALRSEAELAVEVHPDMLAAQGATEADLLELLRGAGFNAGELPVDISELAHLLPQHPDPAPLSEGGGLRHLIFSRAG